VLAHLEDALDERGITRNEGGAITGEIGLLGQGVADEEPS
jgi:hypothetical protein